MSDMNKYTRRRRIYSLWIGANKVSDGLFITNVNTKRGDLERFGNESELLYLHRYIKGPGLVSDNEYIAVQSTSDQRFDRIEATDGLRIEFDISRSCYGGSGKMTLKIFNLSPNHRNMIFQDWFAAKNEPPLIRSIVLSAGFEGEGQGIIFTGQTMFCCSYKQGVDFITEIQAIDGGLLATNYDFGHLSETLQSDMTRKVLIKDVIMNRLKQLGIDEGKISLGKGANDVLRRGVALSGNILAITKRYAGTDENGNDRSVFIDLNKLYIISDDEAIKQTSLRKFDSSNIIGTPKIAYATMTFSCIFEPRLKIGQILEVSAEGAGIKINKSLGGIYSGKYKILTLKHIGGISDSTPSTLYTTVEVATRNTFLEGVSV